MYFTQAGKSCDDAKVVSMAIRPQSQWAPIKPIPDLVAERREVVLVFSREYGMGRGYREAIHQRSLYTDEMTGFS